MTGATPVIGFRPAGASLNPAYNHPTWRIGRREEDGRVRETFTALGAGAYLGQGELGCGLSGDDEGLNRCLRFRHGPGRAVHFEADERATRTAWPASG